MTRFFDFQRLKTDVPVDGKGKDNTKENRRVYRAANDNVRFCFIFRQPFSRLFLFLSRAIRRNITSVRRISFCNYCEILRISSRTITEDSELCHLIGKERK